MKKMKVLSLPEYDIIVGNIIETLPRFLASVDYARLCVIMDENTREHCFPLIQKILPDDVLTITVRAGEWHKNLETCQYIWSEMMAERLGRDALVINLGGGVIGDMGGFCASTYKRGIRFIQIPTTVLSQVDASVGGKLGVDFQGIKNAIGLFNQPERVFLDDVFFKTLPSRETRSGFAEIIKHSLIADAKEWQNIKHWTSLENVEWEVLISRSVQVKQRIVLEDPLEKGLRKALNFGHTIGHAIESYFLEREHPLLHGEAIALGIICETYLSQKLLGLPPKAYREIRRFITSMYPLLSIPNQDYPSLISMMKNDKKNRGNEINCSLIPSIGQVKVNQSVSEEDIIESLDALTQSEPKYLK